MLFDIELVFVFGVFACYSFWPKGSDLCELDTKLVMISYVRLAAC